MRIGHYQFRPKLIPTLVVLLLLPVLISLGIWQLGRADEKRQLLRLQEQQARQPVYIITEAIDQISDIEFRKLKATGKFASQYRIFIDNKVYRGTVGYYVVEPLVLAADNTAVLVNRGWIAATGSRAILPEVPNLEPMQTIEGLAKTETKDVASLGAGNRIGEDWPALVRWIDISNLKNTLPYKLKPYLLLQSNDSQDGLVRDWKFTNSSPEKNISYAVQWFSLAIALFLIYVIVNMKKRKL